MYVCREKGMSPVLDKRRALHMMQSIYNRCREGNVSREKGMSPAQEGIPIKEIHVSTPEIFFGFSPRLRLVSLSPPPSSLPSSSPRLVLFCFAGAQPSKGELLSWCDTSQATSLVNYAIADRR